MTIVYVHRNTKDDTPLAPGSQLNLAADIIECDADDKVKAASGREYQARLLVPMKAAGDKNGMITLSAYAGAGDSAEISVLTSTNP